MIPARRRRRAIVIAAIMALVGLAGAVLVGWERYTSGLTSVDVIDPGASESGDQNILLVGLDSRTERPG